MSLYHNTKQKIRNVVRTIDAVLDVDYPVDSGKDALKKLKQVFEKFDREIDRVWKLDENLIRDIARNTNRKIFQSLPIIGFILRSTNVRNAFEFLEPLQDIAGQVLQGKPELLLSSEWDYIPFAYPQTLEDFKSFVLIGMPASEAGNALLLPLAGHELGHAVWRNRGIHATMHKSLQTILDTAYGKARTSGEFGKLFPSYKEDDIITREEFPNAVADSVACAVFHAEEIFCDLFAFALFGESYMYAFSYILAPNNGAARRSKYPTYSTRLSAIRSAAEKEGLKVPDDISLDFEKELDSGDPSEKFIVRMAERSVSQIFTDLWDRAMLVLTEGGVKRPSEQESMMIVNGLRKGVPANAATCLGSIAIAGWRCFQELQRSRVRPEILMRECDVLNELLLKSIEVLEFQNRTAA